MGSFPTLPLRFEEECEICGLLHVVCGQMLPHVEKLNSTNESETLQGKGWSREEKLQPRK